MSKKYEQLGRDIVEKVGGNGNIDSLHHCQTRLRFKLVDDKKADQEAISKMDGVAKVLLQGGMFQVVIGMDVAECYEEVVKYMAPRTGEPSGEASSEKKKLFDTVTDFVSSIFSPIVPALAGAGMIKALLALLSAFSLIDRSGQTYILLNMFGDATFAFMPILLAYTSAQKLRCNPILAAVTAGIMCHATWTGLVGAGEGVSFFGIPFYLVRYTNSVIPIVLVILVQAPVEKWLNKRVPKSIRLVFVPMIEFIVMGTLAFSILGPLGDYLGLGMTAVFTYLSENVSWLEAMLMGGLYSPLVIFGLHHGLAPLGTMQMSAMGYDGIFGPGVLCANIGQGTSALVTGLMSKNQDTKQVGVSAGITGLMGTTEPALYAVNLPKKYPLIAGMVGGACGGLYAGLTHTHRFATGSSGLPAVVMYLGDDSTRFFFNILIALGIDIVVTAVVTFILYKRFEKAADKGSEEKKGSKVMGSTAETVKVSQGRICAPASGEIVPMSEIPDETFASGILGQGCGIRPDSGVIKAPISGEITAFADTGHAIGITGPDGVEVLVHVGIDTVNMKGEGFTPKAKAGDKVTVGQELLVFDRKAVEAAGYSDMVILLLLNAGTFSDVKIETQETVEAGMPIMQANR